MIDEFAHDVGCSVDALVGLSGLVWVFNLRFWLRLVALCCWLWFWFVPDWLVWFALSRAVVLVLVALRGFDALILICFLVYKYPVYTPIFEFSACKY